jgi:hypothetical protein
MRGFNVRRTRNRVTPTQGQWRHVWVLMIHTKVLKIAGAGLPAMALGLQPSMWTVSASSLASG